MLRGDARRLPTRRRFRKITARLGEGCLIVGPEQLIYDKIQDILQQNHVHELGCN